MCLYSSKKQHILSYIDLIWGLNSRYITLTACYFSAFRRLIIFIYYLITTKHIAVYPEYISFRYITLLLFHIVSEFLLLIKLQTTTYFLFYIALTIVSYTWGTLKNTCLVPRRLFVKKQ